MDLETENRIAAILLKEAAEQRRQTEKEGVLGYLRQPKSRGRPNSRFFSATLLGVQQANRHVEINRLWRLREKEQELDERIRNNGARDRGRSSCFSQSSGRNSPQARENENAYTCEDDGLRDQEIEEFLLSREKRGRGAVGSRMDEAGPYRCPRTALEDEGYNGVDKRHVYGPERPLSLKYAYSSEEKSESDDDKHRKKRKRDLSESSKRRHSCKNKSIKKLKKCQKKCK